MKSENAKFKMECPSFAWIILLVLGCVDIVRGIMHTIVLPYAAENIMGLDLSVARDDQLLLLGTFGISNYITGILYILIAFKARNIVPYIFLVIPSSYAFGAIFISTVANSTSKLGGLPLMIGYFIVCIGTFVAVIVWNVVKRKRNMV